MSGDSLPYHLRPHKAVDRRLFLDLLCRYERWKPLADSIYLSMGAYPLEDHKLIHRILGITRLISFDFNEKVVARQKFNKPVETCFCLKIKSGDLIGGLSSTLEELNLDARNGLVFWLDYTSAGQLGDQIREFQALLGVLGAGDVVRVTVNAHPPSLYSAPIEPADDPVKARAAARMARLERLKERIGEFLPSRTRATDMTDEGLPTVLAEAFEMAVSKAFPGGKGNTFQPLSIVRYADGQQMLSITGAVVHREEDQAIWDKLQMDRWAFASRTWTTIHKLVVPDLTLQERLFLEKGILSKKPEDLIRELGFDRAAEISMKEFLESYKNYYRFYPTLLTAQM